MSPLEMARTCANEKVCHIASATSLATVCESEAKTREPYNLSEHAYIERKRFYFEVLLVFLKLLSILISGKE